MERECEALGRKRIVHVTTVHAPFDPRIFHKQLNSLREAGFDTHLIAPHDRAEQSNGISIHPLPRKRSWGARLALQPCVFREARALDADLYQIHDPELIPLAYLLKKTIGARLVYDMHEDYRSKGPIWGRGLRLLERWCFRWIDHVLLAEESYRAIVEDEPVAHTCILNYGTPLGEEAPAHSGSFEAATPTRLLYTGTVAAQRGLDTMLDVAAEIERRGRPERLDIVGICHHSDQRERVQKRIRTGGFGEVVNRVGWNAYVQPSDMPPYYRRAGVGLALCEPHPNFTQSLPTKFYEYLHYGLPIVCSDFPLWRRFIEKNDCGAVVPPGDAEAVLAVLDRWREQPGLYRRYAQNARAAAAKYRWDQMGRRLVRVYRSLLDVDEAGRKTKA